MKNRRSLLLPVIMFTLTLCLTLTGVFATWIYLTETVPIKEYLNVSITNFYYDIAITDVSVVSKTVNKEEVSKEDTTVTKSTFSGTAGQKVTYEVTAVNYSSTTTYVYNGFMINSGSGASIVTTSDAAGTSKVPYGTGSNYVSGTAIEPGDTFKFYVTYTLTENLSAEDIVTRYLFLPVVYTVTYLENNSVYAVDCVVINLTAYTVKTDGPQAPSSNVTFSGWMNAAGVVIKNIAANNTNNYTLSAKWDNLYSIIFVDSMGNVLYQEHITKTTTALSAAGQEIVNAKLAELQSTVEEQDISVKWSSYSFGSASDIIVRAEYTYSGILKIEPVYETVNGVNDGIVDYYRVDPVDTLTSTNVTDGKVYIPGMIGDIPVKTVHRVTNEAGSGDWNNFNDVIKEIHIGEGVQTLEHNSLSYTSKLNTVYLPSTLKSMGKNTFSRNIGSDKKTLTIHYSGTKAQWDAVVNASPHEYGNDWAGGLNEGSIVICTDGYYECTDIKTSWIINALRVWKWHPHTYGTAHVTGCP